VEYPSLWRGDPAVQPVATPPQFETGLESGYCLISLVFSVVLPHLHVIQLDKVKDDA
jgi:hypothetical protein